MREAFPQASKAWTCGECGRTIPKGEIYQRLTLSGKTFVNCVPCGEIWEEIQARRGRSDFFPETHELGTLRSLLKRSPSYSDLRNEFGK